MDGGVRRSAGGTRSDIKIIDPAQRRERQQVDFGERPAPPTQRLGVFERMAIHD